LQEELAGIEKHHNNETLLRDEIRKAEVVESVAEFAKLEADEQTTVAALASNNRRIRPELIAPRPQGGFTST
jgi:hypothetical protein